MKNIFFVVSTICLLVVTFCIWKVGRDLDRALSDADATLLQTSSAISEIGNGAADTSRTLQAQLESVGKVSGEARKVLASIDNQEQAQSRKIDQTSKDLSGAMKDFRELVFYTHKNLNEPVVGILPQLDLLATNLNKSAPASFDSFTRAADTLNERLSDPQIPELVGHLNVTALHLSGISANAEAMSGDMKLAVHRMAAPPTKIHTLLDVSWTAAKFGSLFVP